MSTPSGWELGLLYAALACFALASLFYIALVTLRPSSDRAKSGLGTVGTIFALLSALVLTAWLIHRWLDTGHAPYANLYEYAIAFAWGVAVVYLVLERIYRVRALGAFVMPVGLLLTLYCLLLPSLQKTGIKNLQPALKSPWLAVHVGTAVLAYGAVAVGFSAGVVYLLRGAFSSRGAKPTPLFLLTTSASLVPIWIMWGVGVLLHRIEPVVRDPLTLSIAFVVFWGFLVFGAYVGRDRLPDPDLLDHIGYRAITFGFPFLTLMIFTGAIWAERAWGRPWGNDPKEIWSGITWLVYLAYLHARMARGWHGWRAAWLAAIGFGAVLFTLFGVNYLGGLHAYSG